MKVYVNEKPKDCFECPCFQNHIECACGLDDGTKDYFLDEIDGGECPLKSLDEHDKQVRNKLIDNIEKWFTNYLPLRERTGAGFYGYLNQLRGENDK